MRFLDRVRDALALPALAAGTALPAGLESPFAQPNHLVSVTGPDLTDQPTTRATAMSVPALARARRLIVGSIARCPLVATAGGEVLDEQPEWLTSTAGQVSPFHRMVWTVDDILFHGWSLWAVARDSTGNILDADRVPVQDWSITPDGDVQWHTQVVDPDSVILIPGLDEGLLTTAAATIRQASNLAAAADRAAGTPIAHTELHQISGEPMSQAAIEQLVTAWISARRSPTGPVSFTNPNLEVKTHGAYDSALLTEGRAAAAVEIARVTGIPAVLLDAAASDSTLRYSNVDARNSEFIDYCLAPLMGAIAARLGLDDCVPHGVAVEFDTTELTGASADELADVRVPDDQDPKGI